MSRVASSQLGLQSGHPFTPIRLLCSGEWVPVDDIYWCPVHRCIAVPLSGLMGCQYIYTRLVAWWWPPPSPSWHTALLHTNLVTCSTSQAGLSLDWLGTNQIYCAIIVMLAKMLCSWRCNGMWILPVCGCFLLNPSRPSEAYIDGLVRVCSIPSALVMEMLQSCSGPAMYA